ncbi:DUF6612 family protein [Lacrimispora sp. 210928-DFI.3.58]|uniref:DUF6612 family protein n=1 Tax=Lacrimispora sp. 210928-DFI.3.58 TaxID=2883214 RepID=UPI0015B57088|nr:DUF6612 family protein [Lacrimispora sp. 210928-DFI.3.58]MCB7317371.1 hypothetical protein [Lacrimispora sp. 210928-DFI.3.58]
MKRLKGFLAAVLSAALLCPATAYAAPSQEALALYKEIEAEQAAMTDMNAFYDFNVHMSGSMLEAQGPMDMRIEMNVMMNHITEPGALGYMAYTRITQPGNQQSTSAMYYQNGYCYIEAGGMKIKYPMALEQMMQQTIASSKAFQMPGDLMEDMSLRMEGENRVLSYKIQDDKMNDYIQMVLGSTGLSGMMGDMTISLGNVEGEYVVNPAGQCVKMRLKMDLDMTANGQSLSMTIDGDIGIANPGEPVEIPYPDLTQYQELSTEALTAGSAQ